MGLYVRAVFIPADVQRLHGTEGRYKRAGIFSRACADHRAELAFSLLMIVCQSAFYTDAQPFKETRECTGQAYGCKLDGPARRVAAFCNPDFRGRCARSARHGGRSPPTGQLLMTRFDAEASDTNPSARHRNLCWIKSTMLHIAGEETVEYYLVQDGKDPVQVTPTPAPENS